MMRTVFIGVLSAFLAGITAGIAGETALEPAATLDDTIATILKLESDAAFAQAFTLARKARSTFVHDPKVATLDPIIARLRDERTAAAGLDFAIQKLTSNNAVEREAAERELTQAGDAGLVYLRKALRDGTDPLAAHIAKLLADLPDEKAVPVLLARLRKNPQAPAAPALAAALAVMAGSIPATELAALHAQAKSDTGFGQRHAVTLLAGAFRTICKGQPAAYDALVRDPQGFAAIKQYVTRALAASDKAISDWAGEMTEQLGLLQKGLRGSYYEGTAFEKLVVERLDAVIQVPDRQFPYPDGRQDEISARWTGFLLVTNPGMYTFYSASDDGQRVWVNDQLLIDDWNPHGVTEMTGTTNLLSGLHPFKVEFFQGTGGATIVVSWSGPDIAKQVIPADVLRCRAWKRPSP